MIQLTHHGDCQPLHEINKVWGTSLLVLGLDYLVEALIIISEMKGEEWDCDRQEWRE